MTFSLGITRTTRTGGILAAAVTVTAALAAPALATPVGKRVAESPDQVRAYWTEERMRNAVPAERMRSGGPVERAKPGGGSGGGGTTLWSSGAVPDPTSLLNAVHGKVFFTDSGVNYVCSGTSVIGGNENVVWTAGHCVHDGPGDFHTNWSFVPAYDSGARPYGTFAATYLFTSSGWASDGEFGYDFGAARVAANSATLTDTVGARELATNAGPASAQVDKRRDSYGYPAAGKFSGQRMWRCDSYVSRTDGNSSPPTMAMPCDMTGGSSGGGWIDDQAGSTTTGDVVSVNSYGYRGLKNMMFGPALGAEAQAVLLAAGGNGAGNGIL